MSTSNSTYASDLSTEVLNVFTELGFAIEATSGSDFIPQMLATRQTLVLEIAGDELDRDHAQECVDSILADEPGWQRDPAESVSRAISTLDLVARQLEKRGAPITGMMAVRAIQQLLTATLGTIQDYQRRGVVLSSGSDFTAWAAGTHERNQRMTQEMNNRRLAGYRAAQAKRNAERGL